MAPTTESGLRSASNAARLINRQPRVVLRWLETAPPDIRSDISRRDGMVLLGPAAIDWLVRTSADKPRLPTKAARGR